MYALGLVLLECLTGAPAYPGAGIAAAVARLHRDPEVPHHIDPALGRLLAAMTSREPALRPTAREVAAGLSRGPSTEPLPVVGSLSGPNAMTGQPPQAIRAERIGRVHQRAWIAAACAAVIVALSGAVASLQQSISRDEPAAVAPVPTATLDAAQLPPATATTASPPAQPAVQPAAPAQPVADDPSAEEGREGAGNQGNGGGPPDGNGEDKAKDKNKDNGKK